MSSSGISATNSGPLAIRTYNNGSNKTFVLTDYDIPVPPNYILITSSNGLLVPSNAPSISSIQVSSIRDKDGFVGNSGEVLHSNGSTIFWGPSGAGSGYWTENGLIIYNNNGGNVGIGTSNPEYTLDVAGSVYINDMLQISTSSGNGALRIISQDGNTYIESGNNLNNGSGNALYFTNIDALSTTMVINTSTGQVGIGTEYPEYSLDIYGDVRLYNDIQTKLAFTNAGLEWDIYANSTSFGIESYRGSPYRVMTLLSTGQVGIGTYNPVYTLDVAGNMRIGLQTGNTSSFSVLLGTSGVGGDHSAEIFSDGTNMGITNQQNGNLILYTNNLPVITMLSNGGVSTSNSVKIAAPTSAYTANTLLQVGDNNSIGFYSGLICSSIIYGPSVSPSTTMDSSGNSGLFIATTDTQQLNRGGAIALGGRQMFDGNVTVFGRISGVAAGAIEGDLVFETLHQDVGAGLIERMRINNVGYVGIGNNNPTHNLDVTGTINATGDITGANFPAPSDIRLKNNINTIENPLSTLTQMRGVSYYLNSDESGKRQIGVIAQEVEQILPEVVRTDSSPEGYKSITYGNITAILIEAVKELSQQLKELSDSVNLLKNNNTN